MPHPSKRKGSTEEWREIAGYPLYEVSDQGRVRSWKNNRHGKATKPRMIKQSLDSSGYPYVGLRNPDTKHAKRVHVHRLVAGAFLGTVRDGAYVCHRDDVKTHNAAENLYIALPTQNTADAFRNGRLPIGEDHHSGKLTADAVREIRRLRGSVPQHRLADRFGIHQVTVSEIQTRKIWRHL